MKKLEDKILKKVYVFETKQTVAEIVLKILGIAVSLILSGLIIQVLYLTYQAQSTLDVLQIFSEDMQTIREYFGDVFDVFYYETPRLPAILLFITTICFVIFVLIFIKNFARIREKMRSIIAYWRKKI